MRSSSTVSRLARHDDFRAADTRRQDGRDRGSVRHRHPPLPSAPAGPGELANPIASIFAWTRGLRYCGTFDNTPEVVRFAENLEKVCIDTVERADMTRNLAILIRADLPWLTTNQFLDKLDGNLQNAMAS